MVLIQWTGALSVHVDEIDQQHKKLIRDKVVAFQKDFESGRLGLSLQVMTFLSDWLKTHIQGTDRKYVPFLREKGLARAA